MPDLWLTCDHLHQIRFSASVRSSVRLCLDTVDESQRRRHGVTAAIVVDVVGALRPCLALCPSVGLSVSSMEFDTEELMFLRCNE